ncbi:hypothetical protein BMG03_19365 (plasmid) [Thioclava nitratireducens]|uniref:Uncharacterized protein n=1 Tax=Thioclava nitratireducens TaxID=1915078 RepID=A0ABM6IM85_9RHOB|nr:hypothetical protein BMG03_19365 [Thioclava nitratireducens]
MIHASGSRVHAGPFFMSKEIRRLREERIRSFAASALIAQNVFAGAGIMAMGVVIVLGGAFDLALPLADSSSMAEAERCAAEVSLENC